jgi:hypothetical protein
MSQFRRLGTKMSRCLLTSRRPRSNLCVRPCQRHPFLLFL